MKERGALPFGDTPLCGQTLRFFKPRQRELTGENKKKADNEEPQKIWFIVPTGDMKVMQSFEVIHDGKTNKYGCEKQGSAN
ncbi:hypothetical protein SAMN04488037_104158 [Shimia marina]|uniref:Uncharacterized protein n=1 Tax=Shimia marina TaxID=321267 RepID=A0A0P1FC43_9RHOB|nr:hypothetical protein SHM7688_03749 [Shimia marina]SFD99297.1 hypothetical protein SAMN04488037_104158 [Shimia marina]